MFMLIGIGIVEQNVAFGQSVSIMSLQSPLKHRISPQGAKQSAGAGGVGDREMKAVFPWNLEIDKRRVEPPICTMLMTKSALSSAGGDRASTQWSATL